MLMSKDVVLIEDDADMRAMLRRFLTSVGMTVSEFENAESFGSANVDLDKSIVVLDINLPDESGFIVAARLRARSMVGIIALTGRAEQEDRLLGLSMGVDHYMTKPIDLRELESVIRNLARRIAACDSVAPPQQSAKDDSHLWVLDTAAWELRSPTGQAVDLSSAEYQLLLPLLESPGKAERRDALNARLGKPRIGSDNRSLDVLVSRVRRKIEHAMGQPFPIRSARGEGYVFVGAAQIVRAANA